MSDSHLDENEFMDLPDDSEEAFAVLQKRRYQKLEEIWESNEGGNGWYHERQYVDCLSAFDAVHDLGLLTEFINPPRANNDFSDFFQDFRRHAEITSQKIFIESARRAKTGSQQIIVLDSSARQAIHHLIEAIREKLNGLQIPENKRDVLFNKLNSFASEIDRNRTRTEGFYNFAVETARTAKSVNDEIKPLQETINRVFDMIEKAKKLKDALPSWSDRKKIDGPQKQLPKPDFGDDISF